MLRKNLNIILNRLVLLLRENLNIIMSRLMLRTNLNDTVL